MTMQDEQSPNRIALAKGVSVAESDVQFTFSRSSGPGGQSVNKLSTRAELRLPIDAIDGLDDGARQRLRRFAGQRLTAGDELLVQSDRFRSQLRNRKDCIDRLAALVERAAKPPKRRKPTRPTRGAVERRLDAKRQAGEKKRRRGWKPE